MENNTKNTAVDLSPIRTAFAAHIKSDPVVRAARTKLNKVKKAIETNAKGRYVLEGNPAYDNAVRLFSLACNVASAEFYRNLEASK